MKNKLYGSPCQSGGAKCKWIFTLIAVLCFVAAFSGKAMAAVGGVPYVTFDGATGTLTLSYGDIALEPNAKDVSGHFNKLNLPNYYVGHEICSDATKITKVVITPSFFTYTPTTLNKMFQTCSNLETIEGLENINTSQVASMTSMFHNCSKLQNISFGSGFTTPTVNSMSAMFMGCSSLQSLDLSSFSSEALESMSSMFEGCSNLTSIKFGDNFTIEKVKSLDKVFDGCTQLSTLDLSKFAPISLTSMESTFNGCASIISLNLSGFNTSSVTTMKWLFFRCSKLKTITFGSNFKTDNVLDMTAMFSNCKALTDLDLSKFNTEKVTNMATMFNNCSSLESITFGNNFTTAEVTSMSNMFSFCQKLKSLDLSKFNTAKVTTMESMFAMCTSLEYLDLSSFNTDKVTNMKAMFSMRTAEPGNLQVLDLRNFTTTSVTDIQTMFYECRNLTTILCDNDWIISITDANKQNYQNIFCFSTTGRAQILGNEKTKYSTIQISKTDYAKIDKIKTASTPGYFTTGKYKIFYELNGGTENTNPAEFDENTSLITLNEPVKEGYTFVGWSGTPITGLSGNENKSVSIPTGSRGNRIYTANWQINQYTIQFETDGGSEIASITKNYGAALTEPTTTKEGYDFAGWNISFPSTMPATDLVLTAQWTPKKYTLTFDTDGGSAFLATTLKDYGADLSYISGLSNPTKTGYDFVKWDKVIPTTMPATDLTITALWTPTVYNINLDYDGGALPTGKSNPTTFTIETETFTLEKPEKTGYTFAGWHTGKTVDPDGVITKGYYAQDLDYTATWDVNQYTITFNTDGGSAVAAITQDYNSAITAPANPTKEHYKFIGWDKAIPATMPAENNTLTAQWEPIEYKITFDYAGGELPTGKSNPTTYTIETPTFTLEKPIRTGYTFAGWNTGKAVDPDGIIVKGTFDDIALTATWQINQYTITFNTDGGSEISAIKQDFNTIITKPADPVKVGYTFLSWDKDIPNTMPAEDVTITAKWQINTHTITFDTDGGTPIDKMTVKYGENITKPTDPVKTGYTFLGWDKQIPETMPDEDLTFKAQWQINQCTITFDTDGADPIEAITQYYNTAITAPANPAKKGFTFLGWQPALPATMPANNLTVKAQWRDDRETIAVDFNGTTSFPTDADKFCNGNETSISLPFTITKGQPSEYIVTFENGTVVNGKVDANNNVLIEIPNDLESGVYKGSVVFNGDPELYKESDAYPVAITANIPKNAALQIYSDVLLVDNHDNNYSAYQWYKDGNAISGATLQFYSEPSFSGRYTVKITDKDGKEFMSCPIKTGVSVKNTKSSVKVYPNPATSGEQFTLKIEEYDPAKDYTIMIFTANGTLVKKLTGLENINTTTLPGGIYSGSLISNGEKSGFKVIVK